STHYLANYFEDDINRDFNYSCYQQAEEGDFEKDKIMKTKRENKWDMFMYSNLLYRELSFRIKFKNNCYVNLSTPG
ncbi:MAG TPA: hypothetical protein VKY40_09585, partial [Halanaerobiales bacterium]|nr:hypothetical protein [Halanaerobiales bacterium]